MVSSNGPRGPAARRVMVKVSSQLLRKARMLAASRGTDVQIYLDSVLRPQVDRDYRALIVDRWG